ncbi:MAG: AMP-binding protein, partial [Leptospiraceae bacterium]|nr:AMP-binding protein [Leptospiraceae bacterium]
MNNPPKFFYDLIQETAKKFPNKVSFKKRDTEGNFVGKTYSQIFEEINQITAGLINLKVSVGDKIAFLCDASPNWILVDISIVASGAVSVPRGTDVTDEDIIYILSHSESKFAIVQKEKDRKRLMKLKRKFPKLKEIFVIESENFQLATGKNSLTDLMKKGESALKKDPKIIQNRKTKINPKNLATLIYTSGTTGAPKGVMLNQMNWIDAVHKVLNRIEVTENDRIVSLLPPWHALERAIEYAVISTGADFLVSDSAKIKDDLREFKPTMFPSVPRIWESVYNGIMSKIKKEKPAKQKIFNFALKISEIFAKEKAFLLGYDPAIEEPNPILSTIRKILAGIHLIFLFPLRILANKIFSPIHGAVGGNLRISVSGGSALPSVVDRFLTSIGIKVLEGYGLTETAAVISVRNAFKPTSGTLGDPLIGYQIQIKDDKGHDVSSTPGKRGVLWVKSDQILMGYYKRPELNKAVFDKDRFFDTGDIMTLNYKGELIFAGRAKDTIALAGGENVEPGPIEDKLLVSEFIDQVMVTGDDKKTLGALIVPNFERVKIELQLKEVTEKWNENKQVRELFKKEITRLISKDTGFKTFELIPGNCFYIVPRNFDPDTEMTRT